MQIKYVALILEKDGKFLVEKRKVTKEGTDIAIVFPGGKVEQGEDLKSALVREMKEELGISIFNLQLMYADIVHQLDSKGINWYACENYEGEIQNNSAIELLWILPAEAQLLTYENSQKALSLYLKNKFKIQN